MRYLTAYRTCSRASSCMQFLALFMSSEKTNSMTNFIMYNPTLNAKNKRLTLLILRRKLNDLFAVGVHNVFVNMHAHVYINFLLLCFHCRSFLLDKFALISKTYVQECVFDFAFSGAMFCV